MADPSGKILGPVSGIALTATEIVTVRLFNHGTPLPAGTSFNVSYTINAGGPVVEMVTLGSTLLPNTSFEYTFATPANLSTPGMYTFNTTVTLPGDVSPQNNTYQGYQVHNLAPSVGGTLMGGIGGVLTLTGHTGSVLHWERSLDAGLTWSVLANDTTTFPFHDGADHREMYRVLVSNQGAPPAYSSVFDSIAP